MQRVERSIRVAAPVDQVYRFWRDVENLPTFMQHVKKVRRLDPDGTTSHWVIEGPMGAQAEFNARLTQDEPNRSIGWNSIDGNMGSTGNVTFTEMQDNTLVHVIMQWYDPPGGSVGEAASKLLQDPEEMLEVDLRRFKEALESGTAGRRR